MKFLKEMSGSERRFIAFHCALAGLIASFKLHIDSSAITAIVTLTLGYLGQGALKEAHIAKLSADKESPS